MASETKKLVGKIATLETSLDELDTLLEPLFSRPFPETTANLEPLQRAKLQTVLPYLIYDLVFTYLKSKGVDPRTHPVVPELDRIRRYFEKISNAENPPSKPAGIDKEAAGRFIKHAITQAKNITTPTNTISEPSTSSVRVPIKVTSKMLERAKYEKNLKERGAEESEEEGLEVFGDGDDSGEGMGIDAQASNVTDLKGKGKALVSASDPIESRSRKRRPAVDPFAGYGDDETPDTPGVPLESAGVKRKKGSEDTHNDLMPQPTAPTVDSTAAASTNPKSSKTSKKPKKKIRKSLT